MGTAPRNSSQSPFSSGEVFHISNTPIKRESILRSQSPFSSGEVFHIPANVGICRLDLKSLCLNPLLVAGKYSTSGFNRNMHLPIPIPNCLNPLLVAGKYSTPTERRSSTNTSIRMSQSPFSSGEVFHFVNSFPEKCRQCGEECLNPLLVAGKYSTLSPESINHSNMENYQSQSPFSSGEVFHPAAWAKCRLAQWTGVSIPF